MEANNIECFYYYESDKTVVVLLIDHFKHYVQKIMNCSLDDHLKNYAFKEISRETAMLLLGGLTSSFYLVQEVNFDATKPTNEQKRLFALRSKINENLNSYSSLIVEEYSLYKTLNSKRLEYDKINDEYYESLHKCNSEILQKYLQKYLSEDMTEKERTQVMVSLLKNRESNGYKELKEQLNKDEHYVTSEELSKKITPKFFEYLKALTDVESHMAKEYSLFSKEYKSKLDEYADKGLFLYCQNTPDLPIDDKDISIDDIYKHILADNCLYLKPMVQVFVNFGVVTEINKREADDIVASLNLLIEGKYWASLRNLYSLIDHHHKLCSEIFNGYDEAKRKFKHAKDRADYITELFNNAKIAQYEEVWRKLNSAIEEINKGTGDRFISRNSIVHGDYEKQDVNPQAKDVVNVFMIYITMRKMIDHMANIEEAVKNFNLYYLGFKELR